MNKESQSSIRKLPIALPTNIELKNGIQPGYKKLYDYLTELLSLQYEVNRQLMVNTMLTDNFMKQADETNGKASSSEGSTQTGKTQKLTIDNNQKRPFECKMIERRKKQRTAPKYREPSSDSQYEPSQEQQVIVQYKLSESKNVPKNYGKSILNFIKKQEKFAKRALKEQNLNFRDFQEYLVKYKNNINTIAQLRALWVDGQDNPYAKILRIISSEYLRKHSLSHIFNSRVQNFAKHVKYRQKILKAIQRPQEFTQMKDF